MMFSLLFFEQKSHVTIHHCDKDGHMVKKLTPTELNASQRDSVSDSQLTPG